MWSRKSTRVSTPGQLPWVPGTWSVTLAQNADRCSRAPVHPQLDLLEPKAKGPRRWRPVSTTRRQVSVCELVQVVHENLVSAESDAVCSVLCHSFSYAFFSFRLFCEFLVVFLSHNDEFCLLFYFSAQAYELSTLTGTQVMLLVASETGHVYTFATPKLQPMITSESGKALIQTCLNSPDPLLQAAQSSRSRMSSTGYEETELAYPVEDERKHSVSLALKIPFFFSIFLLSLVSCFFSRFFFSHMHFLFLAKVRTSGKRYLIWKVIHNGMLATAFLQVILGLIICTWFLW